jgi:hypothetical protein
VRQTIGGKVALHGTKSSLLLETAKSYLSFSILQKKHLSTGVTFFLSDSLKNNGTIGLKFNFF